MQRLPRDIQRTNKPATLSLSLSLGTLSTSTPINKPARERLCVPRLYYTHRRRGASPHTRTRYAYLYIYTLPIHLSRHITQNLAAHSNITARRACVPLSARASTAGPSVYCKRRREWTAWLLIFSLSVRTLEVEAYISLCGLCQSSWRGRWAGHSWEEGEREWEMRVSDIGECVKTSCVTSRVALTAV